MPLFNWKTLRNSYDVLMIIMGFLGLFFQVWTEVLWSIPCTIFFLENTNSWILRSLPLLDFLIIHIEVCKLSLLYFFFSLQDLRLSHTCCSYRPNFSFQFKNYIEPVRLWCLVLFLGEWNAHSHIFALLHYCNHYSTVFIFLVFVGFFG